MITARGPSLAPSTTRDEAGGDLRQGLFGCGVPSLTFAPLGGLPGAESASFSFLCVLGENCCSPGNACELESHALNKQDKKGSVVIPILGNEEQKLRDGRLPKTTSC